MILVIRGGAKGKNLLAAKKKKIGDHIKEEGSDILDGETQREVTAL